MAGVVLLVIGSALAAPHAGDWQPVEVVAFRDFDDIDVRLDGKPARAFLVGLKPVRETPEGKQRIERVRGDVLARFGKSKLFAQVVTRRGDAVGLSIDAFAHRGHGFDHPWDPVGYPYCWSGWGAYNFNAYFLYTKTASPHDNFGDNKEWKAQFGRVVCKMQGAERAGALIEQLGADDFARRQAASKELKAIGGPAVDALRKGLSSGDPEVRRRSREIIDALIANHHPRVRSLMESTEVDELRALQVVLDGEAQPQSAWSAPGK